MSSRKDNLIEAFDALKLALLPRKHDDHHKPKPQTQIQQQQMQTQANAPGFVGGFNPGYAPPIGSYQGSSSGPQVMMPMPVPGGRMSMTMQHALDLASGASPNLLSTYSPPSRPQSTSNSAASRPKPSTSPSRPRASSVPPTPTSPPSENQCEGITKTGKRCTRQVKDGHPLNISHPDANVERFCHQHSKEVLSPSGFYARNGEAWIKFEGL
jgi:hypothetical protein